jgi:hypothetical protein
MNQTTAQSKLQDQQWQRERSDGAHQESLVVAREVFDHFTKLQREIQLAVPSYNDYATGASWEPSWKKSGRTRSATNWMFGPA